MSPFVLIGCLYFVTGAFIAAWFARVFLRVFRRPVSAYAWLDVMIAWPAYLVNWHRAGRI